MERCDSDPRFLSYWDVCLAALTLSASAAVGVALSYPPKKKFTALRIQERSGIQPRAARKDDPQCLFSWLKNTSLCKESLHSHLVGCSGRKDTNEETATHIELEIKLCIDLSQPSSEWLQHPVSCVH